MKKIAALVLVIATLLSLGMFTSCAEKGFDYKTENLDPYVTLGNYQLNGTEKTVHITVADLAATITDDDVKKEINEQLVTKLVYYKQITDTSATVAYGDTVGILYKGVLVSVLQEASLATPFPTGESVSDADIKTAALAMTADEVTAVTGFDGGTSLETDTDLLIGSGKFVTGYEEGLIGASVGAENYPVVVTFPTTYSSTELAGKRAVFFVTVDYKYQLEEARDLAVGDYVAMEYTVALDGADETRLTGYTYDIGATEGSVKTSVALADTNLFHTSLISYFNGQDDATRWNAPLVWSEQRVITVEDDTETESEETVTVNYTATVYCLANVRYMTTEEIDTDVFSYATFAEKLSVDTEKYPNYADYFAKAKETRQINRDVQIKANLTKTAFEKLVEISTVDLTSETMQKNVTSYVNEVNNNIDYLYNQMVASGYESFYSSYASYYGLSDAKEYLMYQYYGYKYSTIETQLPKDAQEYVTNRLVFWQFVKAENLSLTDDEYNTRLAEYKRVYEDDDFMETNDLTEEQMREAILWDYACEYFANTYCDVRAIPAKED